MQKRRSEVLFLGTLGHSDESLLKKPIIHQDQIEFSCAVRVELLRIPRPGKELYGKLISSTQSEPIKSFEIYFRNLTEGGPRFSLLTCNNELLASSTDDILLTPRQTVYTDLLVIKGMFNRISMCIYGYVVEGEQKEEKCRYLVEEREVVSSREKPVVQLSRNIFQESSGLVKGIEESVNSGNIHLNLDYVECWHEITNDDELHETQIRNISNISQTLFKSFSPPNLAQESFIVTFRHHLQELTTLIAKIFKSKHIGLYYPTPHRPSSIPNHIPKIIVDVSVSALTLTRSQQIRSLELLRYILQLEAHAKRFIQNNGFITLSKVFIDFFLPNTVTFSTHKNLIIEVLITLSQWRFAAEAMIKKIQQNFYEQLFEVVNQKQVNEASKERSREKSKLKKGSSDKDSDSEDKKKSKKEKKKDRSKEREKQKGKNKVKKEKEKEKEKGKDNKDNKDNKDKEKELLKKKSKISSKSIDSSAELNMNDSDRKTQRLSLYQIVLNMMTKDYNSRQMILLKMLIQQITQTITRNSDVSQSVAISTGYLRDSKHLFVPSSQLINSKSLKSYAMLLPFLNEIQSIGVDSKYISEVQKVKNPNKYGLDPKIYRLINAINWKIASKEEDQFIMTQYDQQFMTLMSAMINSEEVVSTGLNRIVNSFKVDGLLSLKKQQGVASIICQYIYKVLLEDDGTVTVLYIDQILNSLLKKSNWFKQDASFSRQIRRRVKFLSNYAISYDHFAGSDGISKTFSDKFLKLFKYQHYQINKINEYKKKQYDRSINPYKYQHLLQSFNMGNFYQLLPNQPLLEIDVCLKIFIFLANYNPNIWTTFYQHKLVSGFSVLYNKLTTLLTFFLRPSPQRQTAIVEIKFYPNLIDNYLTIIKHLLILLTKKSQYEVAFNDLIEEDVFQNVELYERSLQFYIALYNSYHSDDVMLTKKKTINKLKEVLGYILQIFDCLLQSFQFTNNVSRENKIKKVIKNMFILHYQSINNRAAIISLFVSFVNFAETNTSKILNKFLLCHENTNWKAEEKDQSILLPNDTKCMMDSILRTNIFRQDVEIRSNLKALFLSLLKSPAYSEKTISILQNLYQDYEEPLRNHQFNEQNKNSSIILLTKIRLIVQFYGGFKFGSKLKIYDKIIKIVKMIESQIDKRTCEQKLYIEFLKTRNDLLSYLNVTCCNFTEAQTILTLLKIIGKFLFIEENVLQKFKNFERIHQNHHLEIPEIDRHHLRSCELSLAILASLSQNPFNQSIILYGQYLEKPYRPNCSINLHRLVISLTHPNLKLQYFHQYLSKIINTVYFILCSMTTIDSRQFYSTESRRNAICALIANEKQFPFDQFLVFQKFVPKDLSQTLRDYFNFPVIQKQLSMPKPISQHQVNKSLGGIYSKYVFDMISEGDMVSRGRFKYINGMWHGGDVNCGTYRPIKDKQYVKQIQQSFKLRPLQISLKLPYQSIKQNVQINELFVFHTKTNYSEDHKKPIQIVINLRKIPDVLKSTEETLKSASNYPYFPTLIQNNRTSISPPPTTRPIQPPRVQFRPNNINTIPQRQPIPYQHHQPIYHPPYIPPTNHNHNHNQYIPIEQTRINQNHIPYNQHPINNIPMHTNQPNYDYRQPNPNPNRGYYNHPNYAHNNINMMGYNNNPNFMQNNYRPMNPSQLTMDEERILNEALFLIQDLKRYPDDQMSVQRKKRINEIMSSNEKVKKTILAMCQQK